jgi:2-iminobutanoate/2-iminopropanoate deaminase
MKLMKPRLALFTLIAITSIALWAHAQDRMKIDNRRFIKLPVPPGTLTTVPFSHGVLVGDTLYISGTLGLDTKTGKPPADVEAEAHAVLDGVNDVLKQANMTPDDLVSVTVYCTDLSQYQKFNGVYRTYFKKDFPARAFIGAGSLLFGSRFEVQAIAVRR